MKFGKPRKKSQGIDVENTYAKFGGPTMIGSWSKIGGTKASGGENLAKSTEILKSPIFREKF